MSTTAKKTTAASAQGKKPSAPTPIATSTITASLEEAPLNFPVLLDKLINLPISASTISTALGTLPKPEIFADMPDSEYEEEMLRAFFGLPSQAAPEHQMAIQEVRRRLDSMGIVASSVSTAPLANSTTTNTANNSSSKKENGKKSNKNEAAAPPKAPEMKGPENNKKSPPMTPILTAPPSSAEEAGDKKKPAPPSINNNSNMGDYEEFILGEGCDSDEFEYYEGLDETLPLDPMRLQIVQAVEHEMLSIYELFASKKLDDDQKIQFLKRKYMQLMHQDIRSRLDQLRSKERISALEAERDTVRKELEKANVIKTKLESLCRDLQSENRRLKEEALKRTDLDNRLANRDAKKLVPAFVLPKPYATGEDDLKSVSSKLSRTVEVFNAREKHFASQLDAFDLELQLMQARLFRKDLVVDSEKRRVELLERQALILAKNESELKNQLNVYVEKFKQVEDTLGKSNDLFASFRSEMEQMTGKLAKLERENAMLQTKCNTLSRNVIEMVEERTKLNQTLEMTKGQKGKLEQLCRVLQNERATLKKNLEDVMQANAAAAATTASAGGNKNKH